MKPGQITRPRTARLNEEGIRFVADLMLEHLERLLEQ